MISTGIDSFCKAPIETQELRKTGFANFCFFEVIAVKLLPNPRIVICRILI
jgi:hypothetical protein